MVGLEKHSHCQLSVYSSANAALAFAGSVRPQAITSRTSEPVEKARSLADCRMTA